MDLIEMFAKSAASHAPELVQERISCPQSDTPLHSQKATILRIRLVSLKIGMHG